MDPDLVFRAINNHGDIIGNRDCRAFLIGEEDGAREILLGSGDSCMRVVDINDSRTVLGSVIDDTGIEVPYLWNEGVSSPLLGVSEGEPVAINNQGQVLLRTGGRSFVWEGNVMIHVLLPDGTPVFATAMNNFAEVVGQVGERPTSLVLWSPGAGTTWIQLPVAASSASAVAINDRGMVLINLGDGNAGVWSDGVYTPLPRVAANDWYAEPRAINNSGTVVGMMDIELGYLEIPFAINGDVLVRFAQAGSAVDINDRGDVIGVTETGYFSGFRPGGAIGWVATSIWSAAWTAQRHPACPVVDASN